MLSLHRRATVATCAIAWLVTAPLGAQTDSAIVVTPSFTAATHVSTGTPIELMFSRLPGAAEGTIAVLLGTADLTAWFERRDNHLRFRSELVPLPSGESDVSVYLVTGDAWTELGRFPLRVLTPRGFTSAVVTPSLATNNSGQLAEGSSGESVSSEVPSFGDVQLTVGVRTSHIRGGWTLETQGNGLGATDRAHALRFGERGTRAPLLDLSDYVVTLQRGAARLAVGNTSLGANRHLMNGFGSRGVTLTVGVPAVSLSLGMLGGSAIVGYSNLLGFTRSSHRVSGASLALELRPRQPGALHLDVTLVNGSLQPRTGFTQNALTDAERSTGAGIQLAASTPSQRIKVAAGVALSRFVNPSDSLLSGGAATVSVTPARKTARYIETTLGLLQNLKVRGTLTANLTAAWRHERVDPLYRSVATFARPDILSNAFDANGNIGVIAIQASHSRSSDNLGGIPSILRTLSRSTTAQAGFPLAALLGVRAPGKLWPTLSYGFSQSHQLGAGVPVNSGFTPSDVPDQFGTVHSANAEWQSERWRASYRFNHSLQDNRQPGREASDLAAATHSGTFGFTASRSLDLGFDLSTERQHNLELDERRTLTRLGINTNWRPRDGTTFTGNLSVSRADDRPRTQRADNLEARLELSQGLTVLRTGPKTRGQVFVRFAHQSAHTIQFVNLDPLAGAARRAAWTLVSGLNLQLF